MKKILVSLCFIFGFTANAFYQRNIDVDTLAVGQNIPSLTATEGIFENARETASDETDAENAAEQNAEKTIDNNSTSIVKEISVINTKTSSSTSTPTPAPIVPQGKFRNGTYTGKAVDASYGIVQVEAIITGRKLSDVKFLSYPNDRKHSIEVSNHAMPILKQEAITAQSENVDTVSGASYTSAAFIESLGFALSQAL